MSNDDTLRREYRHASAIMIEAEADKACGKYPPFNSTHEGYAVILEELDEMWDAIKENNTFAAVEEAIQVGAMALRFVAEFRQRMDREP